MASARDPVEEIIATCRVLRGEEHRVLHEGSPDRDLTVDALRRKLDALASGPFPFLRGTFHVMATDLLHGRVPGAAPAAPEGLIVGDAHLENFGTYRGTSGGLCFDVNDFDEVGWGPLDLDLKRLCTSAMLLPGMGHEARLAASRELAQAWAEAIERLDGRFPVPGWGPDKAEGWLRQLLHEKGRRTQADLVAKVAPEKGHRRFGEEGDPPEFAHPADPWRKLIETALGEYYEHLKQIKADARGSGWKLLDVAYRFKGTGSLGRLRFAALLGNDDERMLLEFKEAAPSSMDLAAVRNAPLAKRARLQTAAIRRLQGDPWPRVAGTHLGELPALGREVQPEQEKLSCARFAAAKDDAGNGQLTTYTRQCGEVLARLHCRVNAPAMLNAEWTPLEAARSAVAFAESYAMIVEADWGAFVRARDRVAHALGVQ